MRYYYIDMYKSLDTFSVSELSLRKLRLIWNETQIKNQKPIKQSFFYFYFFHIFDCNYHKLFVH